MDTDIGEEAEIIAEPDDNGYSITNMTTISINTLIENGWFIVIACGVLYYIWCKKLSGVYNNWKERREADLESSQIHKDLDACTDTDPEAYKASEEARTAAIARLQEKYNKEAEEFAIKQAEKARKKREEWLQRNAYVILDEGQTLRSAPPGEFSPLNRPSNAFPSYRPPRRSNATNNLLGRW